ncbi:hypothetical protein OUZ56_004455 [Daphnia magna]|uniref:Uncharacterized protein n=1 Tax=Daphnia magna TaxID=35525 RepID=A0ABQ9YPU3_9CRUS|nr:hypothetical protein OUZ56_004455 [Daphnia magna]
MRRDIDKKCRREDEIHASTDSRFSTEMEARFFKHSKPKERIPSSSSVSLIVGRCFIQKEKLYIISVVILNRTRGQKEQRRSTG